MERKDGQSGRVDSEEEKTGSPKEGREFDFTAICHFVSPDNSVKRKFPPQPAKFDFHFPDEVWSIILHLLPVEDRSSACQTYPLFNELLHKSKPTWMFGKVAPLLYDSGYLNRNELLTVRKVCSGWRSALDLRIIQGSLNDEDEDSQFPQYLYRFGSMQKLDRFNGLFNDGGYNGGNPFISGFISFTRLTDPIFQSSLLAILGKFGEHICNLELFWGLPTDDGYLFFQRVLSSVPMLKQLTVHCIVDTVSPMMTEHPLPPLPSLTQLALLHSDLLPPPPDDGDDDDGENAEEETDEEGDMKEGSEAGSESEEDEYLDNHLQSFIHLFVSKYAGQLLSMNIAYGDVGVVIDRLGRSAFTRLTHLQFHDVRDDNELDSLLPLNVPVLKTLHLSGLSRFVSSDSNITVNGLLRVFQQLTSVEDVIVSSLVDTTTENSSAAQMSNASVKQLCLDFSNDHPDVSFHTPSFDFLRYFTSLEELRIILNCWSRYEGRGEGDHRVIQLYAMIGSGGCPYSSNIWTLLPSLKLLTIKCADCNTCALAGSRTGFLNVQQRFQQALELL